MSDMLQDQHRTVLIPAFRSPSRHLAYRSAALSPCSTARDSFNMTRSGLTPRDWTRVVLVAGIGTILEWVSNLLVREALYLCFCC
jgi:hypothetical protein